MRELSVLLNDSETTVPSQVSQVARLLERCGIWHIISRNASSKSCRDAANRRYRLGTHGIPLEDELKSFFGYHITDGEKKRYLALHCRATDILNLGKVRDAIGTSSNIFRLSETEDEVGEIEYGLVNPFQIRSGYNGHEVTQIFDSNVTKPTGLPGTMMTNAGHLTWAVEFNSGELIEKLGGEIIVSNIIEESPSRTSNPNAKIGIITGNGPESGMLLWSRINDVVQNKFGRQFKGDFSYPRVCVESLPGMGLSMELDVREAQVEGILIEGMKKLGDSGTTIFTLACNTTPYFSELLKEIAISYGGEFIGIPDALYEYVRIHSIATLSLVGIKFVTDIDHFSGFKKLAEIAEVETISDQALNQILELGYMVKKEGASEKGLQKFRQLINHHTSNDVVVIALTEMSVLLESQKKRRKHGKILIDTVDVYANFIADKYLFNRNAPELRYE